MRGLPERAVMAGLVCCAGRAGCAPAARRHGCYGCGTEEWCDERDEVGDLIAAEGQQQALSVVSVVWVIAVYGLFNGGLTLNDQLLGKSR